MNTTAPTAAEIEVGDTLSWTTWTGETASVTVIGVEQFRIFATGRQYWEATCFHSLDEALAATPGLKVIK